MRSDELECVHGIGHSANTHGCDGCCFTLGIYERNRIKEIITVETGHNGKTHYEGINCLTCRIFHKIDRDEHATNA